LTGLTPSFRVAVASDHAGYPVKRRLQAALRAAGYEVTDFGTDSEAAVDYPDMARPLARAVAGGECERGVLVCGSGIGMSISANRYRGVRAALAWSPELAELARRHNDANVLVLPGRFVDGDQAVEILERFLETGFDGGRHARRVTKIDQEN
jgi:ribose 5-phosphate isomerase B